VHAARVEWDGELARINDVGRDAGLGNGVAQTVSGILGEHEPYAFPARIEQRIAHGVDAEKPKAICRSSPARPFLLDHPTWLLHGLPLAPCVGVGQHRRAPDFGIDASGRARYFRRHAARWRCIVGDRPQGVAGDCNSLAETHARFDS